MAYLSDNNSNMSGYSSGGDLNGLQFMRGGNLLAHLEEGKSSTADDTEAS